MDSNCAVPGQHGTADTAVPARLDMVTYIDVNKNRTGIVPQHLCACAFNTCVVLSSSGT